MSLAKINSNLKKINTIDIMVEVLDELSEYILELNKIQIEEQGTTSFGGKMTPSYAASTIKKKNKKSGLAGVTSRITLFDTEGVASAIELNLQKNKLYFETDIVVNGFELDQFLIGKYGEWRGLTPANIEKLNQKALPLFWKKLYEQLFK